MMDHRLRRLDTGEEFVLAGQMFIGRDEDCEISLEDPEVSRRHAVISVTEQGVVIADNGSTNGMEVSGRSSRRATLAHGQVVRIGETELCFLERGRTDDPTVAPPAAAAPASYVIDQGAGNDTAYRGGYAPLPGDAPDQSPQKDERTAADPADTALMRQLIAHHGLTAVKTPAALMPVAGEKGGIYPLAASDSHEWLLGRVTTARWCSMSPAFRLSMRGCRNRTVSGYSKTSTPRMEHAVAVGIPCEQSSARES